MTIPADLRRQAEANLRTAQSDGATMRFSDAQHLVHELQVSQAA